MTIEIKHHKTLRTTISTKVYENLLQDQRVLNALFTAGVDNWEGYEMAMDTLPEEGY